MNANNVIERLKECLANSAGLVHDETQTMLDAIECINDLQKKLATANGAVDFWQNAANEPVRNCAKRISKLENLLARASEQMTEWQDPMAGPFERILLDIQEALADD